MELYLAEAGDARDFMETPAFSLRPDSGDTRAASRPALSRPARPDEELEVGQRIGPYRVERLLGQGGMGAVYLAARVDEFEMRRVALKVFRRGTSSGELELRFHHERQILARLDHPNIAKLLDGGMTDDGIPYFVMDYVEGEPIDRYCRQHRLGIRRCLELFRKVCSAVHRAHQNLVVHRDIKPANILVGADGEPKLLDFGIAKPLDADGSTATVLRATGDQPMTVAYASPEQIDNKAITTAGDVYSLGVVLYEILTGLRPYRTVSSGIVELAQAIRKQRPRKPSIAAEPGKHRRRLAGDLDSIVLTALRKDPNHRYPSVEKLSADIRRHLEGLPVTSRKPTFAYVASKFIRRHKLETVLAALVLATNLSFSVFTVHLKNEAVRLKDVAVLESERAEEASDFLVRIFKAPGPNQPELTVRELLETGKGQIKEHRGRQPRLYARLAITMGEVYYRLGLYRDACEILEGALADLRALGDREADIQRASLSNDLAAALWAQGHFSEAEKRFRETLEMKIRLYGEEAARIVGTLNNLGTLAKERGAYEEAERRYRRGLAIRRKLDPPALEEIASSHFLLGTLLLEKGDYEEAGRQLSRALAVRRDLLGSEHTLVAVVLNNLGVALQARGRSEESERIYLEALEIRRTLLGEKHPDVAATEINLSSLLISSGRFEEAERLGRRALATFRESKPGHWRIAHAQSVLGSCLAGTQRLVEAEALLLESYPILVETKSECTRYTIDALARLIDLYEAWKRADEAETYRAQLKRCSEAT